MPGPPLAEDVTVRGWSELELWAATDGDDTEWHAKVGDLEPDGRLLQVSWGCLRASYGEDERAPRPVEPGAAKRYSIELTPAFHTFKRGHRIRLLLASADYPLFARSMNRFDPLVDQDEPRVAVNTIHRGATYPSSLRLRVESR
ncbi:MAG: CocE/NonD family hydrolase [Solirubrobacterales bacterium]